jgi:hypothetical protein
VKKLNYILLLLFFFSKSKAQFHFKKVLPKSVITAQYAGSTGFLTVGFSKLTNNNKIELGMLYSRVPRSMGGVTNSASLKFTYTPFDITLYKKLNLQPFQTGVFLSQNFSENLRPQWDKKYPAGYYWWPRSLRTHLFFSSQISIEIDKLALDRVGFYFETNTNDLYVYSYLPNRKAMRIYDIFFFGLGIKLYLKNKV